MNERELQIVNRRRLSEDGATLEELGFELGISKERVRQLENRALGKLEAVLVKDIRKSFILFETAPTGMTIVPVD